MPSFTPVTPGTKTFTASSPDTHGSAKFGAARFGVSKFGAAGVSMMGQTPGTLTLTAV